MTKHQITIHFYKVNISKSLVYLPLHFLKIKLFQIIYLIFIFVLQPKDPYCIEISTENVFKKLANMFKNSEIDIRNLSLSSNSGTWWLRKLEQVT